MDHCAAPPHKALSHRTVLKTKCRNWNVHQVLERMRAAALQAVPNYLLTLRSIVSVGVVKALIISRGRGGGWPALGHQPIHQRGHPPEHLDRLPAAEGEVGLTAPDRV